jgi:uncharacterized protein (DUF2141 family)
MACCRSCATRRDADSRGGFVNPWPGDEEWEPGLAGGRHREMKETARRATAIVALGVATWLGACGAIPQQGRDSPVSGVRGAPHPNLSATVRGSSFNEFRITVAGIRSSSGTVLIGLYDSAESFDRAIELSDKEGFLNDPSRVAGAAMKANAARASGVVFLNLSPGRYGIIVFQDENGNGRLDKNVWGVPTEPYGFSNNAQGFLGPPTFADAAMTLDGSNEPVDIALVSHRSSRSDGLSSLSSERP